MNSSKQRKLALPDAEQIAYLQGDSNYTHVFLRTGNRLIVAYTLWRMLAECWPDLVRVHKSFAVNPRAVKTIHIEGDQKHILIELLGVTESTNAVGATSVFIPIARRQSKTVLALLQGLNG